MKKKLAVKTASSVKLAFAKMCEKVAFLKSIDSEKVAHSKSRFITG